MQEESRSRDKQCRCNILCRLNCDLKIITSVNRVHSRCVSDKVVNLNVIVSVNVNFSLNGNVNEIHNRFRAFFLITDIAT